MGVNLRRTNLNGADLTRINLTKFSLFNAKFCVDKLNNILTDKIRLCKFFS